MHPITLPVVSVLLGACVLMPCHADITRVYHPEVDPLEKEIEFRTTRSEDELDKYRNTYTMGYGQAINEKTFVEGYAIATKSQDDSFDINTFDLEAQYQITETGSRAIDYGVLVEMERKIKLNVSEVTSTLLMEKEFDRYSATANLGVSYKFGTGIDGEFDDLARLQLRYRLQPSLQPAVEIYIDQYDKAAGFAVMGLLRPGHQHKLNWEAGILFGLNSSTPNTLLRCSLEYEF